MRPFFKDSDFNFLTEIALGSVYRQAADVGEVLTTVDRIQDGKARSWVGEWTATADRLTTPILANSDARLAALRNSLWVVALFAVAALFFTGLIPVKPIGRPKHDVATSSPADS